MINTVHYTNNTDKPMNLGGKQILPGETRPVDARFAPAKADVNANLKLWFINLTDKTKHFGDITVEPEASARLPANHFVNPNTPADMAQTELFLQLLGNPIATVTKYLSELTPDELSALINLEQTKGENRKSLVEAIDKEITHQKDVSEFDPSAYAEHLKTLRDDDLELEVINVKDDVAKTELVDAERAARSKG